MADKMIRASIITLIAFYLLIGKTGLVFSQNLISNGSFESNEDKWMFLTGDNNSSASKSIETADAKEGQKTYKIVVDAVGVNAWDIQAIHDGWYPIVNEEYKMTFYARAETNGTKLKVVQQNTTYEAKDISLTTSWQKYEWNFKAKEGFLQLKFHFFDKGVIYLDDVIITGKSFENMVIKSTDTSSINIAKKFQQIEGFGSALAFYENWIPAHPNKNELYNLAFSDLGLDWLRIRNDYRYQEVFTHDALEFVQEAKKSRGDSLRILMCSWTPPAELKSNDGLNNGTLKKENGQFVYEKFADYWGKSLEAYAKMGIKPDWISIQNEPDWLTDKWETCKFEPKETAEFPGYDKALSAVSTKIKSLPSSPKILGAEMLGIGNNQFEKYHSEIASNPQLYAYAYHLYNGGNPEYPDSFIPSLEVIKNKFGNRPNVMTEYENHVSKWYKASWLINNVLTTANATAYFYWDLIWPDGGLIDIDNPWSRSEWENDKGFKKNPDYYAFKHFSKFIDAGYTRIDLVNSNKALKSSAYIDKSGNSITVVMVNPYKTPITTTLNYQTKFSVNESTVYQSVEDNYFKNLGKIKNNTLLLPAESVTTIVLKGN